jgi:hypothetical protein
MFGILAGAFDEDSGSSKFPRVITEEFPSQLIFLVFDFSRQEHTACLLWLDSFLLNLEDGLRLRGTGKRLHALSDELMLSLLVSHKDLSRWNIGHYIKPPWGSANLASRMLSQCCLANSECCEIVFAHSGWERRPR